MIRKLKTPSIVLLGALVFLLAGCTQAAHFEVYGYESPYDWSRLKSTEERYEYYDEEGRLASYVGIDVSEFQGEIDWARVSDDGIDFAMIRLGNRGYTEGELYLDPKFQANLKGAQSSDIAVGIYFFSQAINEEEAREEAEFVLSHLDDVKLDYPVVFDHESVADAEGRANNLSREQATKTALAFCRAIEEGGYTPMLYGNKIDMARFNLDELSKYDVWFAEYDVASPHALFDFTMWQYTNNGLVSGIETPVDMNIHFLSY